MGFDNNLITGMKLFVLNIVAGFLTAVLSWAVAFILILLGVVQSAFAPFLLMVYIVMYLLIMLLVGGFIARKMFNWE